MIDTIQNELLKSAELTGQWEKKLRMIEDGTYQVGQFMEELKVMVNEIVHYVKLSSAKTITIEDERETLKDNSKEEKKKRMSPKEVEPVRLTCPKCGQGEVVKGKTAWGCSLYRKSCDFLIPMEIRGKKLTQKQVESLVLKGKTGKLSGFKDETGGVFNGILHLDGNRQVNVEKV